MPDFTPAQWLLAILAATSLGVSKAGFSGLGLLHVIIFAFLFGARESTGVVLPLLLVGDVGGVSALHRHAQWSYVRRMLPPTCVGVAAAALFMRGLTENLYKPVIGWIILTLGVLQVVRMLRPDWFGNVPHARWFVWTMGLVAGAATMLANAAGPIFALYVLAVALPKLEIAGTSAWFFFIINAFKVPFSYAMSLIHPGTLLVNLVLVPPVIVGVLAGRWLIHRVPQRLFDLLLLIFAVIAALRLIGVA